MLGVGSSRSKGFSGEEKKGIGFDSGFSVPMDKVVGVLFEKNEDALSMLNPVNIGFFLFFLREKRFDRKAWLWLTLGSQGVGWLRLKAFLLQL